MKKKAEDYEVLDHAYRKSNSICQGSPDQFQYHQNQLLQAVAEFLLEHYWNWQEKEAAKKSKRDKEKSACY